MTVDRNIEVTNNPSREQLEQIYNMLDQCFAVGRAFFQQRLDLDSTYDPKTTWFATVDNTIASNVQIFPLELRVGTATLKTGAMGSVGTHPDYRGLGLAPKILSAQTEYMKQENYDISVLLASKHAFYEKSGWRLTPETYYAIDKPNHLEQQTECEIIPFDEKYVDDLAHIYEEFNTNRTYTLVRDETYWKEMITWPEWKRSQCLLVRKNNKIVAYGLIEKKDAEHVYLCELQYVAEGKEHVIDLFHALCQAVPNAKKVFAMLPEDHALYQYFTELNAEQVTINISMWKFINFNSTFLKLQSELEQRLLHSQYANEELHIELKCEQYRIYLDFVNGALTVNENALASSTYITLAIDERTLISAIIQGYKRSEQNESLFSTEEEVLISALFPKQNSVFYLTDRY